MGNEQTKPSLSEIREDIQNEGESQEVETGDNLYSTLEPMLYVCSLIYTFATLRKVARDKDLQKENLVLTEESRINEELKDTKRVRDRVDAKSLYEFIDANNDVLDGIEDLEINSYLTGRAIDDLSKLKDSFVTDFDDEFNDTQLVYGIVVNGEKTRITVVFRGSVTGSDWFTNANINFSELDTPEYLKENGFDKTIWIHGGFKSYVFDNSKPSPERKKQKYDEIVDNVMELYENEKYKDYGLFVTGHSLGGALATVVAFKLASQKKLEQYIQYPVNCISFASPYVGDDNWNEAFQVLERNGRLRHLRVSNENDLVPVSPPTMWYTHAGVNLYLKGEAKYEIGYRNLRSMWWQWSFSPGTRHGLTDHWERKNAWKTDLEQESLASVYGDESITRNFAT